METSEAVINDLDFKALPNEWKQEKLGTVCDVQGGYAFKSKKYSDSGRIVVKIGSLQNGTVIEDKRTSYWSESEMDKTIEKYELEKGDVLIAMTGATTGKLAIVPRGYEGSLLNQRVGRFLPKDEERFNKLFGRYFFQTNYFQREIGGNILKSAQGNISPTKIKNIEIPLPPLSEQQKIASILSTVQDAIEQTEAVIQATRELKKSMMKHLFTYGSVPVNQTDQVELEEHENWRIPQTWEFTELKNLCGKKRDTIEPENADELIYVGLEHIQSGNIFLNEFGSPEDVNSTKNHFYSGDILYGKLRPYLDKCVLAESEGICSTDILVFSQKPGKATNKFLVYLFHTEPFLNHAIITMTGVNHPRTSWNKLKKFSVPCPDIEIQEEIAAILDRIEEKIIRETDKKKSLESLFKSLLEELMTAKTRVV